MPRHPSNSDRIAKAAAEAEAKAKEKAAKPKKAAKPRVRGPRAPKAPQRWKYVFCVGPAGGDPVATFPYNQKAAAEAEAARIGKSCVVTQTKVPMVDEPAV